MLGARRASPWRRRRASPAPPQRGSTPSSVDRPAGATYTGKAFDFRQVAPGVYHAVGTGALAVGCNASIVVNDDDVLVVDTHMSPGGAWALREELKALTPKPVRYVINTHWHWDHAHGNAIYGAGVEIIGHEYTRQRLAAGDSTRGRSWDMFIGGLPARIDELRGRVTATADAAERLKLQTQLAVLETQREGTKALAVVPPTVTVSDHLTLFRGGREIRLIPRPRRTPAATSSCSCPRNGGHHRRSAGRGHLVSR